MSDPLTADTYAAALDELLDAAEAMLATCGEVCTRRQTRDDPAEYAATHEEWAARHLAAAVAAAKATLAQDAEASA